MKVGAIPSEPGKSPGLEKKGIVFAWKTKISFKIPPVEKKLKLAYRNLTQKGMKCIFSLKNKQGKKLSIRTYVKVLIRSKGLKEKKIYIHNIKWHRKTYIV